MIPVLLRTLACTVLLLLVPTSAQAHVRESMGYSTIRGEGAEVFYTLELEYPVLARAVDLGEAAVEAEDDDGRAKALAAATGPLGDYLGERLQLFLDGAACDQQIVGTSVTRREEAPYAAVDLTFACPGGTGAHEVRYDVLAETDAVVEDHSNVVDYRIGEHAGQTVLDWDNARFTVGDTSLWRSVARFGETGVEHILSGADHVLFVLALLIGATTRRQVVGVLSMFTLAHSITLISALLGWVSVPARVVEPLIALSIAFVALENLLGPSRRRYPAIFAFGLLHGLGFAGSLRVSEAIGWDLVASLLGFNVGIEVGQALLALVAVPLLLLVRRLRHADAVLRGATVLVALLGTVWFVERFSLS